MGLDGQHLFGRRQGDVSDQEQRHGSDHKERVVDSHPTHSHDLDACDRCL
jgi:hypothetical protein